MLETTPQRSAPVESTVAVAEKMRAAALELFARQGAATTTVREITAACGVTPGALYNHFASKDALLHELIRDRHLIVAERVAAEQSAVAGDPVAELAAIVGAYVDLHTTNRDAIRVANREYMRLPEPWRGEIVALRRKLRDVVADVLLAGQRRGVFALPGGSHPRAARITATAILDPCMLVSEWYRDEGDLDQHALRRLFVAMALRLAGARSAAGATGVETADTELDRLEGPGYND